MLARKAAQWPSKKEKGGEAVRIRIFGQFLDGGLLFGREDGLAFGIHLLLHRLQFGLQRRDLGLIGLLDFGDFFALLAIDHLAVVGRELAAQYRSRQAVLPSAALASAFAAGFESCWANAIDMADNSTAAERVNRNLRAAFMTLSSCGTHWHQSKQCPH